MNSSWIDRKGRVFLADLMGAMTIRFGGFVMDAEEISLVSVAAVSSYRKWCEMLLARSSDDGAASGIDPDSYVSQGACLVSRVIRDCVLAHGPLLPTAEEIEAQLQRYVGGYIHGCNALSPVSGDLAAA